MGGRLQEEGKQRAPPVSAQSPGNGAESGERPQQELCYIAKDEPGVLDLEEWRKRWAVPVTLLFPWSEWLVDSQGGPAGIGGQNKTIEWEGGGQEEKICRIHQGWGQGLQQWTPGELRLGTGCEGPKEWEDV